MSKIRCPRCKNPYENFGLLTTVCPHCIEKLDDDYQLARDYVKEHQGALISEVAEATGVSYAKLVEYVKMELLEITVYSNTFLKCAACGAVLYTGSLCDDCKKKYSGDRPMIIGKTQTVQEKMHITINEDDGTGQSIGKSKKKL